MKNRMLVMSMVALVSILPDIAVSCPVCFGDKASAEVEGAKWAIVFLLGVTGTVLSGVVTFVLYMRKRGRMILDGTDPNQFNREL